MKAEPEIKPALTATLSRAIENTLNDPEARKRIEGKTSLDYTEMLENEKMARPFILIADAITNNDEEELVRLISKQKRKTVEGINHFLYCAMCVLVTYEHIVMCLKSYESAMARCSDEHAKNEWESEIEKCKRYIKNLIETAQKGNLAFGGYKKVFD
jgi:hypothetical protein